MSDIFEHVDKNNSTAELIIDKNQINQCYITDDLTKNFPKIPKFGKGGICNGANFAFSQIDEIVKDIRDRQDNAMAMEFTKCIGELLKKNGVVPKLTEYTRNFETDKTFETRYGVSIDELDFTEHDKTFEDKIAKLEKENKSLNSYLVQREQDSTDMIMKIKQEKSDKNEKIAELACENEALKQRISELESKLEKKECIKTMRIEFHADNGEMLTPLEVANSLINQNTFKVDELRELAEHLQVYCRHHNDKETETISF